MINFKEPTKLVIIWRVFIGVLPKEKVEDYLNEFKNKFESSVNFPEYVKCMYIPIYKGDTCVEVLPLHTNIDIPEIGELLGEEKEQLINLRISKVEKSIMLQKSKECGFKNLSEYLRFVGLNTETSVNIKGN
jgi:hypothetical protein